MNFKQGSGQTWQVHVAIMCNQDTKSCNTYQKAVFMIQGAEVKYVTCAKWPRFAAETSNHSNFIQHTG